MHHFEKFVLGILRILVLVSFFPSKNQTSGSGFAKTRIIPTIKKIRHG
jgi:hypothetical protein